MSPTNRELAVYWVAQFTSNNKSEIIGCISKHKETLESLRERTNVFSHRGELDKTGPASCVWLQQRLWLLQSHDTQKVGATIASYIPADAEMTPVF